MIHLVKFENDEVVSVSVVRTRLTESPTSIIVRTASSFDEAVDLATTQYNSSRQRERLLESIEHELSLYSFHDIDSSYTYVLLATDIENAYNTLTARNISVEALEFLERSGVSEIVEV